MKLTLILTLFACMQVSANVYSQTRITLKLQDTELKKVLSAIEKKSSYRFLYNDETVPSGIRVNVNANNTPVTEVLDALFTDKPFSYKILANNLVVITTKNALFLETTVTGKVTASTGEALAGVSINVKGSSLGTQTDANGNFSLTVPDNATLVVSYVGYESTEVAVGGRTEISITLTASTRVLDQVVVVGYGTSRKRDLTGSVASVKGSDIAKQPVQTATQAIQGRVAGVQVTTSGAPNALPTVRVRGTGTMLGGANPLYVVDNVITDDIRNINSADIVTMDILKDASATAIYGMRAANGVLIITTKKGRTGKMVVSYDGTVGIREAANLVDMAGPQQYANYLNEASVYYGSGDSLVTGAQLASGQHTDWVDAISRRAFYQNHNVSVGGGNEKITYFLSAGYLNEEGILLTNKLNRFTLRSNNEYKFTPNLKLSALVSYSRTELRNVNVDMFNNAYRAAPYVPAKVNGRYGNTSAAGNVGNPLLQIETTNDLGIGNRLQGTFAFDWKPITWLALRSSMGIDLDFYNNRTYDYKYASDTNTFLIAGGNQQRGNSALAVTRNEANKWVWDNTATVTQKFGDHSFNLLVGVTSEQYKFNSVVGRRLNVPENRDQWFLGAGSNSNATNNNTGDKWTRNSYISRLNYNFDNRYLLTATFRADGTSRFSEDNRWGYFPSIGAGWNISSEKFMDDQKVFDNLKLRASWGKVGNDQVPSSLFYSLASINIPYYFNGGNVLGISFNSVTDKDIRWETTEEFDIGLEFASFNNRLTGEIDYYNKQAKDALVEVNIPGILGDDNNKYITNAGTIENKGIELNLNWSDNLTKDWNYSVGGNIAFNKNRIVGLNGGQPLLDGAVGGQGTTTKSDNNQPIGSFFLWEVVGILQTDADVAASGQSGAVIGDLKYRDANNDKVINDLDRVYLGAYIPKVTYGFNGNIGYKTFDLSFNTYGTAGGKIYNGKKATRGADPRDNIEAEVAKERWTPNNTNTAVPRARLSTLPASSYFLEPGDFFRLNNLTIGYTFTRESLLKAKISNLRVYVTGQNLFTISPYSGFTPELQSTNQLNAGIELNSYPTTRTFAVGVNLAF